MALAMAPMAALGSAAPLLWATGDSGPEPRPGLPSRLCHRRPGHPLCARGGVADRPGRRRRAAGVALAAVTVDRLAAWAVALRDAAPRVEMLLGRSRGEDALGAVGVSSPAGPGGSVADGAPIHGQYFALWLPSAPGRRLGGARVDLASASDAGRALREGRADAVVGLAADVEAAAGERGGTVLATTVDAPHLVATILVARGELAARYPDAVRRIVRGLLDADAAQLKTRPREPAC